MFCNMFLQLVFSYRSSAAAALSSAAAALSSAAAALSSATAANIQKRPIQYIICAWITTTR